jgi:hypothetical protein
LIPAQGREGFSSLAEKQHFAHALHPNATTSLQDLILQSI